MRRPNGNHPEVVSSELLPRQPHALPVRSVANELGVDPSVGLNDADVERRRRLFGHNFLTTHKPVSDLALQTRQLGNNPVMALLAMALSYSVSGNRQ
ncbi:MAG: cation-transporting P-type ATPase [Candidatus Sericytochromatia bacterium]